MHEPEKSISKINFNSYQLSPLCNIQTNSFGKNDFQKFEPKIIWRNSSDATILEMGNIIQQNYNFKSRNNDENVESYSIFNSDKNFSFIKEEKEKLFLINSSILSTNKTDSIENNLFLKDKLKFIQNYSKDGVIRKRLKFKKNIQIENSEIYKNYKIFTSRKSIKSISNSRLDDKKLIKNSEEMTMISLLNEFNANLTKLNLSQNQINKSNDYNNKTFRIFKEKDKKYLKFPKPKRLLKLYLENMNPKERFESALEITNNRRNSNHYIKLKRSTIKKVNDQFKDSAISLYDLNSITISTEIDGSIQREMRDLYNKLQSYSDFTLIQYKEYSNTQKILENANIDSEDDESLDNELYREFFKNRKTYEYQENEVIFGIDPFEIYEKYCKWFQEEMPKTEKIAKESFKDIHVLNLCKNIFKDINYTAEMISNLPYLKIIRQNLSIKSKKRKRIKKPKYFICEICQEEFKTGCSLGGHMSRIHPKKSISYNIKKIIRKKRERHRNSIKKAKELVLKINGFNYQELLEKGKNGKNKIKKILNENKAKYMTILKNIRIKEGLVQKN